jgi:hypothetical protein
VEEVTHEQSNITQDYFTLKDTTTETDQESKAVDDETSKRELPVLKSKKDSNKKSKFKGKYLKIVQSRKEIDVLVTQLKQQLKLKYPGKKEKDINEEIVQLLGIRQGPSKKSSMKKLVKTKKNMSSQKLNVGCL